MAGLSYLVRRGGALHFRVSVPLDLRPRFGRTELRASLGTGRMREARAKAFALAAFVRGLVADLRAGIMADLTSEQIFDLTKREFRRILDDDRRARLQRPGGYTFGVRRPDPDGIAHENWFDTTGIDPWNVLTAAQADDEVMERLEGYRWPDLKAPVLAMLKRFGVDIAPNDPVVNEVCHEYAKAFVEAMSAIKKREYGFHDYVPEVFQDENPSPQEPQSTSPLNTKVLVERSTPLSDVYKKYRQERIDGGRWREKTVDDNDGMIQWLFDHFGDPGIESISGIMMREFKDMLKDSNTRNATKKTKKLAPRTINNILNAVTSFFSYALENKYILDNPARGLLIKTKKGGKSSYEKFTQEDLRRIFTTEGLDGESRTKPWAFWIPTIAIFTGCRLEEIAQLLCRDVQQDGNIWFLNLVEDTEDKKLKTAAAHRKVPLHTFITDVLHFPQFVASVNAAGHERIFHDLRKVKTQYVRYVSKWFNQRYLPSIGVKSDGDKKCFHSLRHTMITNLQRQSVNTYIVASIVGHEAGLITIDTYGEEYQLSQKLEAIMKLDFGDLSHLAQSRFVVKP